MSHQLATAISLACKVFESVNDSDGEPYIMHCIRVMQGVASETEKMVAVMHDVVEDTHISIEDLIDLGFPEEVVEGVRLVTHPDDMSYADYVIRLKPNPIARAVKMSDLRDNTALNRALYRPNTHLERDLARLQKYLLTYQFLEDRIDQAEYLKWMATVESKS